MKTRKMNAYGIKGWTACLLIAVASWTTSQEKITAIGTASQDNHLAIELVLTGVTDKSTGRAITRFEVRYKRQRLDNGEEEYLKNSYNVNTIFDRTAEAGIRYRYTAYIRSTTLDQWMEVITTFPIIGLRPTKDNRFSNAKLHSINAIVHDGEVELSWEFSGLEDLDLSSLTYEVFIGGVDNSQEWLSGMGTKNSSTRYMHAYHCTESRLKLPGLANAKNLGVCILATTKEETTKCFCRAVSIEKAKGTRAAIEPPSSNRDQIKPAEEIRQVDALQADKSYGLSFIPERRTTPWDKQQFRNKDPKAYHAEEAILLDSLITIMEGLHQQRTNQEAYKDCLQSSVLDTNSISEKDGLRKLAYAYWSKCVGYELNSLKIEIQKDSCRQERCVSISPNKYTLITRYQMTNGKYVWMELPKEDQLNEQLIKSLQVKLQELGYYHGLVDGKFNARLRLAILNYQQKQKMPIGNLDVFLINHLGLELD